MKHRQCRQKERERGIEMLKMVAKVVEIGFRLIFFWTGWQALQSLPLFLGSGALMQVWPGSHKATKITEMSRNVTLFAPDPIPDQSRSDPLNASLHVHYIQHHPADLWPQPTCVSLYFLYRLERGASSLLRQSDRIWSVWPYGTNLASYHGPTMKSDEFWRWSFAAPSSMSLAA